MNWLLVLYVAGVVVTAPRFVRLLHKDLTKTLDDGAEDRVTATLFGTFAALVWPLAAVVAVVYWWTFVREREPDRERQP